MKTNVECLKQESRNVSVQIIKNVQKIVALITKNIYNGKPATWQCHRTMQNDTDSKLHRNNLNF